MEVQQKREQMVALEAEQVIALREDLEEVVIHLQLVLLKEIMEELELIHLHLIYKLVVEVERQQLEQVVQVEELWELVEQEQILLLMQAQ